MHKRFRTTGVIPARYGSTRLPGKPLADIGGKPMIVRVYEQAMKSKSLSEVLVATDDERIADAVEQAGGTAIMTGKECESGTDRAAWVMKNREADYVVNIQGDEPFIQPEDIDLAASVLTGDADAHMGTLVKRITSPAELRDPSVAKVTVDKRMRALYFSRSPVPFCRSEPDVDRWPGCSHYYKHIGIYSYTRDFLLQFSDMDPSSLEKAEKLEQLRALENGYTIKVAETHNDHFSIDTPDDLRRAQAYFR